VPPCAPCPDGPWVVLAAITLPATASQPITDVQLDTGVRRVLYSTAALRLLIISWLHQDLCASTAWRRRRFGDSRLPDC
jgi:hypothetical protein